MGKYFPIYKEAVSYIWLCNCSILNFLIYGKILIFFFISVEGLTVSEVNGKYEQGTNYSLQSLPTFVYVFSAMIEVFWPCIITVPRYLLFALLINSVLAFHSFPFFLIPFLRPFTLLNYIPVPFSIPLTRLFPLFNVQIAHPLDILYTGPGFLKSLFFSFYIFIPPSILKFLLYPATAVYGNVLCVSPFFYFYTFIVFYHR